MAIFDTLGEVNLFLILTAYFFGDWYAPTLSLWSDYQNFRKWYKSARKIMWLPHYLFFPVFVVALYVLMETSFFSFFKNAFHNVEDPDWVVPAIAFLLVVNLCCTKQWISVYMRGSRVYLAFALIAGMIATGVSILGIFGRYEHWLELGTYLPFFLWCAGALYMTTRTWYVEKSHANTEAED